MRPLRNLSAFLVPMLLAGLAASAQAPDAPSTDLLPSEEALGDWTLDGQPRSFPADSLWKYINGAAEQYLSFGCTSLTVAYYVKDRSEITLEIYRMADRLGAFGIYQLERPSLDAYLPLGAQGYHDDDCLGFFGDLYYVKLQAFPSESLERGAMQRIGLAIAELHLSDSVHPKEFGLFPMEDLVPDSFEFVPSGALGLGGFTRAVAARYAKDGHEITVHVVRQQDVDEARTIYSSVRASLEKRSTGSSKPLEIESAEGVQIGHRYHGTVWLLRRGSDLLLIAGVGEDAWPLSTVEALLLALGSSPG